ncbi:unnamed protein product [Parnassius apollo]|uniref:(apollo) hypothetical protein n=1 Tax=Parnassius apollo TaxID=110799 RepID=A0A8S3WZR0_PARAO|nr:unnamed protein product [Parnassius apollo]
MSGKPASVAASRAGVASVAGVAGAPRVLLYVAERQLEPAAAGPDQLPAAAPFDALYIHENIPHQVPLPQNTLYRTQPEQNDQRNTCGNLFYKHLNDEGKLSAYEATENIVTQRSDFFPVSQQFLKEPPLKVEDSKNIDRPNNVNLKIDSTNSLSTEYSSVETFQARVPVETGEIVTYQRCPVSSDNMPSMLPVRQHHTQNQFNESSAVQGESEGTNSSEREVSMNKGYVNYQFLEQSATHQSIVNQSINILNQQIGVSRTIGSEGDSGSAPQLVRTADGVVLAVLPSSTLPHCTETEFRTAQSEFPQTITVPLGWRRIVTGASVLYIRYVLTFY